MNQPSTPTCSVATLRTLGQEASARHPELQSRLEKAANIVVLRHIARASSIGSWWVQSEVDPTSEYLVHEDQASGTWTCLCQDFIRRGGPCKHSLAIRLLVAAERQEARRRMAMERHVTPAPACGPDPDRCERCTAALARWSVRYCETCAPGVGPSAVDAPIPFVLTPAGEALVDELEAEPAIA
jgi:hypothetical protein